MTRDDHMSAALYPGLTSKTRLRSQIAMEHTCWRGCRSFCNGLPAFYDSIAGHDAAIDFLPGDYRRLAAHLQDKALLRRKSAGAIACREQFSFEATIEPLLDYLSHVRERCRHGQRTYGLPGGKAARRKFRLHAHPLSPTRLLHPPGGLRSQLVISVQHACKQVNWLKGRVMRGWVARWLPSSRVPDVRMEASVAESGASD